MPRRIQMLIRTIAVCAFFSTTSIAVAGPWCHAEFAATDGTHLRLDYQVDTAWSRFDGRYTYIHDFWLHATRTSFTGDERVRFVFMSFNRYGQGPIAQTQLDATWNDDALEHVAAVNTSMVVDSAGGRRDHPEFAIVIDDTWLKDPVSGDSNFRLIAADLPGFCANPY